MLHQSECTTIYRGWITMDTLKGWVKRREYIRCSIDNSPADVLSSGSEVNSNIDILRDHCNTLNLINALMLGKNTKQRPQLQPPVIKWDSVPVITAKSISFSMHKFFASPSRPSQQQTFISSLAPDTQADSIQNCSFNL